MVTAYSSWWPDTIIWRSLNGGTTWTKVWDWTRYPSRSFRYIQDVSAAPWLDFGVVTSGGRPGAEVSPKLGWMTETLEIDPFNSNRMMYGTGATIYGSDNLTTWDSGGQITISVKAQGLEETAIQDLISPPSGPPLISGMFDVYGFRHDNLNVVPATAFKNPVFGTRSLDYAELSPGFVFRVGDGDTANGVKSGAYSTNGGSSWTPVGNQPAGLSGGGTGAVNANGTRLVWAPSGVGVFYSSNSGSAWTASSGIPAGARVASDRVNLNKFYGYKSGTFYVSTNGGVSFTASSATGLPVQSAVRFKAVPGREGDIWLAGGAESDNAYGLWHSTDSGATFTRVAIVDEADSIGFGKAATGQTYVALYTSAQIGGVRGIFRSDDAGAANVETCDSN